MPQTQTALSTRRARNQGAWDGMRMSLGGPAINLTGGSVARRSWLNQKRRRVTYATPPRALVGRWAATRGGQRHVKVNLNPFRSTEK